MDGSVGRLMRECPGERACAWVRNENMNEYGDPSGPMHESKRPETLGLELEGNGDTSESQGGGFERSHDRTKHEPEESEPGGARTWGGSQRCDLVDARRPRGRTTQGAVG